MYLELYGFIAQNKDLFRFFYSVVIALICFIIVLKTDRLFRISSHQGIRYFRNAFFFYGLAFIIRYILAMPVYFNLMRGVFEFFMIMGGFFLFYSLLWKKFEGFKEASSLFNFRVFIFYDLAFIIVIFDYLWGGYNFMFLSQILLFAFASIISYGNYKRGGREHKFLKLYFIVMMLNFIVWILNFIFASFGGWRLRWMANIYVLNVIIFLIFLYGVIKVTKKSGNL